MACRGTPAAILRASSSMMRSSDAGKKPSYFCCHPRGEFPSQHVTAVIREIESRDTLNGCSASLACRRVEECDVLFGWV